MEANRIEIDALGPRVLPMDALYGATTARGAENFDISSRKLGDVPDLLRALACIKQAAAAANRDIGLLPQDIAAAIISASTEIVEGKHSSHFPIDLMEGSGGTSINMNVNEVVANRALQLMGDQPGRYERIHPNDHVNAGQSTNDVVPSAVKLAVYGTTQDLTDALSNLAEALEDRSSHFAEILRIGRTCLQAGQPMRLGQAFSGYAEAVRRLIGKIAGASDDLLILPLGGTAIGTGLGSAPGYRDAVYRHLRAITGIEVRAASNMFDAMQNADAFSRMSAELRVCAEVLGKISSDLVILSSDPACGIGELRLPIVQPGSSIMPGKINPVMPMMIQQVAFAVIGNDTTVSLAALHGQLEINHFEPVIASRLLDSIGLLTRSTRLFAKQCVAGIEADKDRSLSHLMRSPALATALVAKLGYDQVSKLVKAASDAERPFVDLVIERSLMTHEEVAVTLRNATHKAP